VQFYFALKENRGSNKNLYVIYCGNENAYIYENGELIWAENLGSVNAVTGNPILILNEESVWYPLMERDDTGQDPVLNSIVGMYSTSSQSPELTDFEENLIGLLRQVTELNGENQLLMATVVAGHRESPKEMGEEYTEFRTALDNLGLPSMQWRNGMFQEIYKRANFLSPITAYLVWISQEHGGRAKIQAIVDEYLKYAATPGYSYAHGHLWRCGLTGETIDESYRTKAGHCVWQAANISAVLGTLNINNYIVQGFLATEGYHHSVYVPKYDLVISNGAIQSKRGTVLSYGKYGDPFCAINYISHKGEWAHPRVGSYLGTLSPNEAINALNYLKNIYNDDIRGLSGTGEYFSVVSYSALISGLGEEQSNWGTIELP
jgi:hypothetical protein